MNEKFQYRTRPPSAVLKNFEFIVIEFTPRLLHHDNDVKEVVAS